MAPVNRRILIQGGMGIAVSSWQLARAVSLQGQLGVVSGTALDGVLARRLQDGDPDGHVRRELLAELAADELVVRNDPLASPTGFPFKVAELPGTLSDPGVRARRARLCDLGYRRTPVERPDGSLAYRCAAEPVHMFVKKGGQEADTVGRVSCATPCSRTSASGSCAATGRWSRPPSRWARTSTAPGRCSAHSPTGGRRRTRWPGS